MFRKIEDVIRAPAQTAQTERANWEGRTDQARFEGAAAHDRFVAAHDLRVFGKRPVRA